MKWITRTTLILGIVVILTGVVWVEVWVSNRKADQISKILTDLNQYQDTQLEAEKSKHEIVGLRIKNEIDSYFKKDLISVLAPTLTGLIALITAVIALRRYLDERKKDRLERAAVDLKNILEQTVNSDPRVRTIGVVGLQHFFTPDKEEYHLRALSSLVATARSEDDKEVIRSIRIAAEQAVTILPEKTLSQVSWQGVKLKNVNFSYCNKLSGLDFRDANLEDADLSHCDLEHSDFTAASLMGARFNNSNLQFSNLTYADLAGADFSNANLSNAIMNDVMVLDMNLDKADLQNTDFDPDAIDWALTKNWRRAKFPPNTLKALINKHGPDPTGLKVLMLMWEIPPLVAGGTWTACYHWVRKLRLLGVNITVVVPWDSSLIMSNPFGTDVEVVSLGVKPHYGAFSSYGSVLWSQSWNIYGNTAFDSYSPYGGQATGFFSPYGYPGQGPSFYSPYYGSNQHFYGPYSSYSNRQRFERGTGVLRIADIYARKLERYLRERDFNIIHAHDWVTFDAAEKAARLENIPWVAHFHSTEHDRHVTSIDKVIFRIEDKGAKNAVHIVTPSRTTALKVEKEYNIGSDKITVIPNVLSQEFIEPNEVGVYETGHVVFLGRLTKQKAPDRFSDLAREFRISRRNNAFFVWGEGEEYSNLDLNYNIKVMGGLSWQYRGWAFDGASAVYVPSRSEPFGMVILEAMQHRVPVLYPVNAGVSEVIETDLMVNPEDIRSVAEKLRRILDDWQYWEDIVEIQESALEKFIERHDERQLLKLWTRITNNLGVRDAETEC